MVLKLLRRAHLAFESATIYHSECERIFFRSYWYGVNPHQKQVLSRKRCLWRTPLRHICTLFLPFCFTLVITHSNRALNSTFCHQSQFEKGDLKADLKSWIYVYAEFTTCGK